MSWAMPGPYVLGNAWSVSLAVAGAYLLSNGSGLCPGQWLGRMSWAVAGAYLLGNGWDYVLNLLKDLLHNMLTSRLLT